MKEKQNDRDRFWLILCFCVYLLGVGAYVFWSNQRARQESFAEIDQRLLVAAQGLKYMLAPDFHDRALDENSIGMAEELRNRRAISGFADDAAFKYVYTLVEKNGRFYFSAPTVTQQEARERERWYFYPYEDVPAGFIAAFREKRIVYADYRDQWGQFRSVALPQVSPGGRLYLACADYETTYIRALMRRNYLYAFATAGYFLIFFLLFVLAYRKIWRTHAGELQKLNADLLEHKTHLEDLVRERTSALEQSNQELKQQIGACRRYEEELENQRAFLRQVIDINPDFIFAKDRESRFTLINQAAAEALGGSVEELTGRAETEVMPNREEAERFRQGDLEVIDTAREKHVPDDRMTDAAGRVRWLQTIKRPLLDAAGKVTHVLGVSSDITELKKIQEERLMLEVQLQRSQKLEAIGVLAGGVAHDLNNILSGLVSYPDLLLLDLPQDSPLRRSIIVIKQSGEKAAAIVQDLLALARGLAIVRETIDLNEIVHDFQQTPEYQRLMDYHARVRVETVLGQDLPFISGSFVHLAKILMNLTANAIEAMPEGGLIRIATGFRSLAAGLSGYEKIEAGAYVVLTVSDTGIGIAPQDLARIFEPFYTKKVMGRSGSGLGLAVVWGTVKDHRGYIDIHSALGEGTRIEVYFPVSRQELLPRGRADGSLDLYQGSERILIVDDVEQQRLIATEMLVKLGYEVVTAAGGEEAVQYLKDHTVDLVLLDMIMDPGLDGLDTFKRILEVRPGQRAVLVSGFSETDRVKEALVLGAGAYVRKPFLLRKIAAAVRAELDREKVN